MAASWEREEIDAVLAVRKCLVEDKQVPLHEIGEIELITITLNSKLRVPEAVEKFMTYREQVLQLYNIPDVWAEPHVDGLDLQWHRFAVAGRDDGDRQIMWIQGSGTPVAEETACVRACCHYFFAVHSDMKTLRDGITIVIDVSGRRAKVGNEKKLQVTWQNFPSRPQHIHILGTSAITRIFVNGLISFAALFAKSKVLARIQFSDIRQFTELFGTAALPEVKGGPERPPVREWVRARLDAFPKMNLPEYASS
ncbi:hypothetical protein AB1Y20_003182 [Prymnesium parvum]|uniref:CRAL-TRIO domain-containing protein n=1 Tax=Prymnesium parvum TaxID=97485 RepID=A0AB34JAU0_PRYPA